MPRYPKHVCQMLKCCWQLSNLKLHYPGRSVQWEVPQTFAELHAPVTLPCWTAQTALQASLGVTQLKRPWKKQWPLQLRQIVSLTPPAWTAQASAAQWQ